MTITFGAGEREVVGVISATVLTGNNVFDVKAQSGEFLRQKTVFATVASPLADQLDGGRVHQAALARTALASTLRTPRSVLTRTSDSRRQTRGL